MRLCGRDRALLAALSACASSHFVRPLGKGGARGQRRRSAARWSQLGGATFPTPIVDVGGGYGVRDDLDLFLRANLTAAAFGDLHLEPGVAYHPLVRDGGAGADGDGGRLAALSHRLSHRGARACRSSASRRRGRSAAGATWSTRGSTSPSASRGAAGCRSSGPTSAASCASSRRVGLALEAKYLAPNYDTGILAPAWVAPGGYGYVSVLLGVNVYFGGVR